MSMAENSSSWLLPNSTARLYIGSSRWAEVRGYEGVETEFGCSSYIFRGLKDKQRRSPQVFRLRRGDGSCLRCFRGNGGLVGATSP